MGVRDSREAVPLHPLLEPRVHLCLPAANDRAMDGVHQHLAGAEGLVPAGPQLPALPAGGTQAGSVTELRDAAVVIVPPRAPAVGPRKEALEQPQLQEGDICQQPAGGCDILPGGLPGAHAQQGAT